jgi:hypothetical protein
MHAPTHTMTEIIVTTQLTFPGREMCGWWLVTISLIMGQPADKDIQDYWTQIGSDRLRWTRMSTDERLN